MIAYIVKEYIQGIMMLLSWIAKYKTQRAILKAEAEFERAGLLKLDIARAQREYDRIIKQLADQGFKT